MGQRGSGFLERALLASECHGVLSNHAASTLDLWAVASVSAIGIAFGSSV